MSTAARHLLARIKALLVFAHQPHSHAALFVKRNLKAQLDANHIQPM